MTLTLKGDLNAIWILPSNVLWHFPLFEYMLWVSVLCKSFNRRNAERSERYCGTLQPEIRNWCIIWSKSNTDSKGKTKIRARRQHIFTIKKRKRAYSNDQWLMPDLKTFLDTNLTIWGLSRQQEFFFFNVWNTCYQSQNYQIIQMILFCTLQFHFRSENFK